MGAMQTILSSFDMTQRSFLLAISALQNILVFVVPPIVAARLENRNPCKIIGLEANPHMYRLGLIALLYVAGMAFLNQLIFWNDHMILPQSMHSLEQTLRVWEESSRGISDMILSDSSVWGLVSGVGVVGLLTGFSEELFFRGGLQRMLGERMNPHAAIWVAAAVFSLLHFQFYGFLPRMLLGAFFGYLYIWSGSIWTAVFAHALNNTIVVVAAWLTLHGIISNPEEWGVSPSGMPWSALASAVIFAAGLTYSKKLLKRKE